MAYEHEESNKQIVFTVDNESSMDELNERIKELDEVYRKAGAFDHIKVIHDKNVNEMSISDTECIEMIGNELEPTDDER